MRFRTRILAGTAAAVLWMPPAALAQDVTWSGSVAQGRAIEIKGVNGDIRAEPSGSNQVEVVAVKQGRRDDPESVRVEVVPHGGGVTICAVYPARAGARQNECAPGEGGRMNVQNNDVTVRFTVRVPAGVTFIGTTVNGSAVFSTTGSGRATTVNGSIRGEMGRADWSDTLSMNTVNGSITLTLPASLSTEVKASTVNGDI